MHVVCHQCGAVNRVPVERLGESPVCGRCKTAIARPEPVAVSDALLPDYLDGSDMPVIVDFWAEWCAPCRMMAPQFAAAARELPEVRFVKVDTEAAPQASVKHRIRSIPTMILFSGGREVARVSGAMQSRELVRWIRSQTQAA